MSKAEAAQSVGRHLLVAGVMVTAISVGTASLAADSSGMDAQPGALMLEQSPEPIMLTEIQMDEVTAGRVNPVGALVRANIRIWSNVGWEAGRWWAQNVDGNPDPGPRRR